MKPRNEIDDNSEELQKKKAKMEEEKTSPGNEVFGSFQKKKNQGDTEKRNKFRTSLFSYTVTQNYRPSSNIVIRHPVLVLYYYRPVLYLFSSTIRYSISRTRWWYQVLDVGIIRRCREITVLDDIPDDVSQTLQHAHEHIFVSPFTSEKTGKMSF